MNPKCDRCPMAGRDVPCIDQVTGHGHFCRRLVVRPDLSPAVVRLSEQAAGAPGLAWHPLALPFRVAPHRELVVAHYAADLGWLGEVPTSIDRITVYSKGDGRPSGLPDSPRIAVIPRPNHGREAETIASHVAGCHGSLADQTYFAQDDPFDHSPDFLARLAFDYEGPTSLTTRYLPDVPPAWIKALDLVEHHHGHAVRYGDARADHLDASGPSRDWFDEAAWDYLFETPCPKPLWFGYGAMWAVPRTHLVASPAGFWRWLAPEIVRGEASRPGSSVTSPPLNPWSLEALWRAVFDPSVPIRWREPAPFAAWSAPGDATRPTKPCCTNL